MYRRRQWHPTLVLLPGESRGWRSLEGCSPWGHWGLDTTEQLHFHFYALEKEMETHSSVLVWRIPGTGEPDGLPSMGSHSRTRLKWLSSSSRYMYVHTHTHTFKFALPICYGWGNKMTMLLENLRFIKSHKILQEPRKSIPYLHGCIFETSSVYYLISSKSYILKNWHFRKQD